MKPAPNPPPEDSEELIVSDDAAVGRGLKRSGVALAVLLVAGGATFFALRTKPVAKVTKVTQISAPVFDHAGRVALAVMVLGPATDLAPVDVDTLVARVREAGSRATDRIGGHAP